jgi:sortase A
VLLVLFVAWQLVWTDVVADAEMDQEVASLQASFADPASTDVPSLRDVKFGQAFAIVRIPQFGLKYARPLYEGTTRDVLMHGIGHYATTALPGEVGNFAVAGHRTTYGKPFNRIDELRTGDVVIVETRETWFVYRVSSTEVVAPSRSDVLLPVPGQPGAPAGEELLTMTSCHPEFSSRERYVVHATLDTTYPHAQDLPADLLTRRG